MKTEMKSIFLPLSPDYVGHWGFWEAVRELIQNADDADDSATTELSGNTLVIKSQGHLEPKSLLLGNSSKRDDSSSVGKYGEGYKLAMLVLSRMGYGVIIRNGETTWYPSFGTHPELETECLQINMMDGDSANPKNHVQIEVTGLFPDDVAELYKKYLKMNARPSTIVAEHEGSQVIEFAEIPGAEEKSPRCVYVNGLFVSELPTSSNYFYSYNFTPDCIDLDRDRSRISDWDLQYQATKILTQAGAAQILQEMIEGSASDISSSLDSISYYYGGSSFRAEIQALAQKHFVDQYGEDAYPINKDWNSGKQAFYARAALNAGLTAVYITSVRFDMLGDDFAQKRVAKVTPKSDKVYKLLSSAIEAFDGDLTDITAIRDDAMLRGI